jgi:hypothetical protein
MAELEQTARYALKLVPSEVLFWVIPELDADLAFVRWLDTQTIAFPGEPDRRCDTVAELVSRSGQSPPWALILEVEARARRNILARVLEYRARLLRKLRHGPRRRDPYLVVAVVFFLRGEQKELEVKVQLPGTDIGHHDRIKPFSLATQNAAGVLERIGREELGRSILPWVPLMLGGGDEKVVQEWVRLANMEANAHRRSEYAALAQVFAAWKKLSPVWKQALEGLKVEEISIVREWKEEARNEARVQERRGHLLMVLGTKFPPEIPAELARTIDQTADPALLSRWFQAALKAPSLEAFRSAMAPPAESKP